MSTNTKNCVYANDFMKKLIVVSSPEKDVTPGQTAKMSPSGHSIGVGRKWYPLDDRWKLQEVAVCYGYANHIGYSDVNPFEIITMHLNRKQCAIREMNCTELPWEKEFYPGGFFGHTANMQDQKWEITPAPDEPIIAIRLHKDGQWRDKHGRVFNLAEQARKFYDYNF